MIALLSALLGFATSTLPELLRLFREGKDRAHEVTLLKLQIGYDRERMQAMAAENGAVRTERLEEITLAAEVAEQTVLNERLKDSLTGIHWVDALAGTVRPMITYAFFLLYFFVKCAQYRLLVDPLLPWLHAMTGAQALVMLWTEEDIAIFSAVIAFWFGQRMMLKAKR